ncbi:DUF5640 domain-containing protein [Eubacteriales bacterium OttesenSCG-928-N14]|nr:DUF5640 domain-containing protein [Eubacteriales bacterium OttesenSCG-928-N14]
MNRNKKVVLGILLLAAMMLTMVACGGSSNDALSGTWEGTYEDGAATWTFDGKGKCTLTNVFSSDLKGSYTIDGEDVSIKLDDWENAKLYHYKIDGSKLTLTADDAYSPNYELQKK